jgi:hypothetical protein
MKDITIEEIEAEQEEYRKEGVLWSPNSVYHGAPIAGMLPLSQFTLLRNQVEEQNDFIEFLFEHSEHCDHISQRDAWKEYYVYMVNKARGK